MRSPPAGMQNPMSSNLLIIGSALGTEKALGPLNMVDFIVSADQPTQPVGHVSLSADATQWCRSHDRRSDRSFTRVIWVVDPSVSNLRAPAPNGSNVTPSGTAWVGTKISQPIHCISTVSGI